MVSDENVTHNVIVSFLLFIPFFLTLFMMIGKCLFDDGLVFMNIYFNTSIMMMMMKKKKKNSNDYLIPSTVTNIIKGNKMN